MIHGTFKDINELSNHAINKIFNITVVKRKTSIDFFYNFKFLNTLKCEVEDMELSFEDLYLTLKAPTFEQLKQWYLDGEEALLSIWLPPGKQRNELMIDQITDKQLQEIAKQAQRVKLCTISLV